MCTCFFSTQLLTRGSQNGMDGGVVGGGGGG